MSRWVPSARLKSASLASVRIFSNLLGDLVRASWNASVAVLLSLLKLLSLFRSLLIRSRLRRGIGLVAFDLSLMKSEEGKDREHNYDEADEIDDAVHGA